MKKDKASTAPAGEGHGRVGSLASRSAFGPEAWGPLAAAWAAFHAGRSDAEVLVHGDDGASERMPVSIFFRGTDGLRPVDQAALDRVSGRTLDCGAGVGSVALILQGRGIPVTAGEVIPEGVAIMRERGVEDVKHGRVQDLPAEEAYDTILLLMNGTAMAGTLGGFPSFLGTLAGLLAPGGQVLMDSTDLLDRDHFGGPDGDGIPGSAGDPYPGEVQYQLEFEGSRGAPFPQLFLDPATLRRLGTESGWSVEVVWEGEDGEYLARLTLAP